MTEDWCLKNRFRLELIEWAYVIRNGRNEETFLKRLSRIELTQMYELHFKYIHKLLRVGPCENFSDFFESLFSVVAVMAVIDITEIISSAGAWDVYFGRAFAWHGQPLCGHVSTVCATVGLLRLECEHKPASKHRSQLVKYVSAYQLRDVADKPVTRLLRKGTRLLILCRIIFLTLWACFAILCLIMFYLKWFVKCKHC